MSLYQQVPILISQTPTLQKFQVASQNQPHVQQTFLGALAVEKHKKEAQQVTKTEKSDSNLFIKKEKQEHKKHREAPHSSQAESEEQETAEYEDDPNIEPGLGNILNTEV